MKKRAVRQSNPGVIPMALLVFTSLFISGCYLDLAPTLNARYDHSPSQNSWQFFWSSPTDAYLSRLRTKYQLDGLISGLDTDIERVEAVTKWVHGLWAHNGSNIPAQNDPIYILERVAAGERFRCVEYAIVTSGCLNALGLQARTLGLKTKDVETRASGAGHVITEVWLRDAQKWVFVDAQEAMIPFSGETPLSALELQKALAEGDAAFHVWTSGTMTTSEYSNWISDYLYFFDTPFDNRIGDSTSNRSSMNLMLVPLGEKNPIIFQRINYCGDKYQYTNSATAFYAPPQLAAPALSRVSRTEGATTGAVCLTKGGTPYW